MFLGFVQDSVQIFRVTMFVDCSFSVTEPDSVDDATMVELVADHQIFFSSKLWNETSISCEASLIDK